MADTPPSNLDIAQQVLNIAVVLTGGMGAYIRFFKGRVFYTRILPDLEASFVEKEGTAYLLVKFSMKNIGITNVELRSGGQILILKRCKKILHPEIVRQNHWEDERVFFVFTEEQNIEPDETVCQERAFAIPKDDFFALSICLEVTARKSLWPILVHSKTSWIKYNRRFYVMLTRSLKNKNGPIKKYLRRRLKKLKSRKVGNHIWRAQKIVFCPSPL